MEEPANVRANRTLGLMAIAAEGDVDVQVSQGGGQVQRQILHLFVCDGWTYVHALRVSFHILDLTTARNRRAFHGAP